MENAQWKGRVISAFNVAENYEFETLIRKASAKKELFCLDTECQNPVLKYCNGDKRGMYFAHINNNNCDYAKYDKENTPVVKKVKETMFKLLKTKYTDIQSETKVLPHHYTHLLLTTNNGTRLAIEIGNVNVTVNKTESLKKQYGKNDIAVKWMVIDDQNQDLTETQTYHIKRNQLNENKNNELLVVDSNATELTQSRMDTNLYEHNGKTYESINYPKIFSMSAPIESITLEDDDLSIEGFHDEYNKWINKKRKAFDKKIADLKEKKRIQRENEMKRNSCAKSNNVSHQDYYGYRSTYDETNVQTFVIPAILNPQDEMEDSGSGIETIYDFGKTYILNDFAINDIIIHKNYGKGRIIDIATISTQCSGAITNIRVKYEESINTVSQNLDMLLNNNAIIKLQ